MNNKRKIVQICVVVRDIQKSMEKYWKILGIGPWDVHTFSPETVREFTLHGQPMTKPFKFMLAVAMLGDMQFELIQPVEGLSLYENFLKEKGEGFHHIKEKVDDNDIEETLEKFKQRGVDVIVSGKFGEDVFYYLNTEPTLGIIYEIGNCGKTRAPERRYPPDMPK
ncbi:VOC family protein [Candidatus Aerophobetes bacterium]|nr:VOC family protein [Candidatus Aerophobetes bacterium]